MMPMTGGSPPPRRGDCSPPGLKICPDARGRLARAPVTLSDMGAADVTAADDPGPLAKLRGDLAAIDDLWPSLPRTRAAAAAASRIEVAMREHMRRKRPAAQRLGLLSKSKVSAAEVRAWLLANLGQFAEDPRFAADARRWRVTVAKLCKTTTAGDGNAQP